MKISGFINDNEVSFRSINELRKQKLNETDKIQLMGAGYFFFSLQDIKDFVGIKRDRYGYSMNKRDKNSCGYYKNYIKKGERNAKQYNI